MGALKAYVTTLKEDVGRVLQKPSLVLSIMVIGFFMVWFASEQVRFILSCLVNFGMLDERLANKFTVKYFVFGLSLLTFLWVDLVLINFVYTHLKSGFSLCRDYWHQQNTTKRSDKQDNSTTKRRYSLRSQCRFDD